MEKILIVFSIIYLLLVSPGKIFAAEYSSGSSAALMKPVAGPDDNRVKILKEFLKQYNSPLVEFADSFVESADRYKLDWKLVIAISGVESTFGQQIPYNSYNGWGWGIYGDNMIRFSSWNEGIQTVSEGLKTKYIDTWGAENVYDIGRYYAASPTWAQRVDYFMQKIQEFSDKKLATNLSLSL